MAPKPSSRSSRSHDMSIVGDEQERHRIQLEHNLQHNDLSLHLSSAKDDCSVEYPRRGEQIYPAFPSFHHSVENLDPDEQSHTHHGWSYRTADDDDDNAVNPYAAGSLSTAAHHASAVTFTAGLGRRDQTQSGAEYDPERPLHNMIAGVDSKLSMFQSKSNNTVSGQLMFDPLVVDDSAQLDRVLGTGRTATHVLPQQLHSPLASSSSSSSSSARPKLSDALHVAFSPKRPRSSQTFVSPRALKNLPRHTVSPSAGKVNLDVPTPRPRSKTTSQPQIQENPPTPSTTNSKFTKIARGLARDIEIEQNRIGRMEDQGTGIVHNTARDKTRPKVRRGIVKGTAKGRVYLPDITGLTSAVESPARGRLDYHHYDGYDDRECDARILATLSVVQQKLAFIESENGVSRRRVKELELELESCKKEVARERTRILAMEMEEVERQHVVNMKLNAERKGKAKAQSTSWEEQLRYKEAVEEKKALEALITSLRSHLSRLTSELSSHQVLLTELRALRDADAQALQSKSDDVDLLREQVERLEGEVEVLKGVVEEGLKERRMVRKQGLASQRAGNQPSQQDAKKTQPPNAADSFYSEGVSAAHTPTRPFDKTIRTDFATAGSSQPGAQVTKPFISSDEVDRISLELDDRRSNRSGSPSVASSASSQSRSLSYAQPYLHSRPQSPSPQRSLSRISNVSREKAPSPELITPSERVARPAAPTPVHALGRGIPVKSKVAAQVNKDEDQAAPFPQIRGERLERLFFSAPEHNAYTCNVCRRKYRRNGEGNRDKPAAPSWLPSRFASDFRNHGVPASNDDEGFEEGTEDHRDFKLDDAKGKSRETVEVNSKLPPQTVLAHVLRELEDDFTHYKGIYVELSDQYKLMDAISNVVKRNVLADHLREVIDILEQKGDQIASLYDLLTFEDKPLAEGMRKNFSKHPTAV